LGNRSCRRPPRWIRPARRWNRPRRSLAQGIANRELARVSATRYGNLEKRGIVSRQENDTYQARYQADAAAVDALQKGVSAAQNSVSASEANLARLKQVFSYLKVRAPFAGVITLRNVDQGTLVAAGNTMLFRVAQTGSLRTFINAPQMNASEMRAGQSAQIAFNELPGKVFEGKVARSAGALDPATRTLLVEVQVANPKGELMPGMYANVTIRALARRSAAADSVRSVDRSRRGDSWSRWWTAPAPSISGRCGSGATPGRRSRCSPEFRKA
jgi:RND family efflux transporter MFP subunit